MEPLEWSCELFLHALICRFPSCSLLCIEIISWERDSFYTCKELAHRWKHLTRYLLLLLLILLLVMVVTVVHSIAKMRLVLVMLIFLVRWYRWRHWHWRVATLTLAWILVCGLSVVGWRVIIWLVSLHLSTVLVHVLLLSRRLELVVQLHWFLVHLH